MASEKIKIEAIRPFGDPTQKDNFGSAVKIGRGVAIEIAKFWGERLIAQGLAKLADAAAGKKK